jgi:predicted nucleic acid-binding protein
VSTFVVDASVAAKWFLPATGETLTQQALQLLRHYAAGELRFLVPDLFWAEFANIIWRRFAKGDGRGLRLRLRFVPCATATFLAFPLLLLEDAFAIASAFDQTVYDGLYIALAVTSKTELITADERLANALAAYLPVKWLGSL